MNNKLTEKEKNWIWVLGVTIIFFGVTGCIFDIIYALNDDTTIQGIVSGFLTGTPDAHLVYMSYPLGWVLKLLYMVSGGIPWLGIFLCGCFTLSFVMGLERILEYMEGNCYKIVISLLYTAFWCSIYMKWYVNLHYTVVAAALCATAIFMLTIAKEESSLGKAIRSHIIEIIMLILAYQIRSQVFWLASPFVLAAVVFAIIRLKNKKQMISFLCILGVIGIGVLGCFFINKIAYQDDEWKEYVSYNDSRTALYDYSYFQTYEDYEKMAGDTAVSEAEYEILSEYNLVLSDEISADDMSNIAKVHNDIVKGNKPVSDEIKEAWSGYFYRTTHTADSPYNYITIVLYLLLLILCILFRNWLELGAVFLLGIGRSLVWIYLIYNGRYPERIIISIYAIELSLLFALLAVYIKRVAIINRAHENITYKIALQLGGTVLSIVLCMTSAYTLKLTVDENNMHWENNEEWKEITAYMEQNENAFYWLDVYSFTKYSDSAFEEKVDENNNYCLLGGWLVGSPLLEQLKDMYSEKQQYVISLENEEKQSLQGLEIVDRFVCQDGTAFIISTYN